MKTKLNLALKIIILILVAIIFVFYILATATDYWQTTKYNVNLYGVGIFTGDNKPGDTDAFRYTSSHSGLWNGCAVLNGKKICASLRVQYGKAVNAFSSCVELAYRRTSQGEFLIYSEFIVFYYV